jgi:hypothetical protein
MERDWLHTVFNFDLDTWKIKLSPNVAVDWLSLPILEAPSSDLGPETGFPFWGFSWFSSDISWPYPKPVSHGLITLKLTTVRQKHQDDGAQSRDVQELSLAPQMSHLNRLVKRALITLRIHAPNSDSLGACYSFLCDAVASRRQRAWIWLSVTLRPVIWYILTDVSEIETASIIRENCMLSQHTFSRFYSVHT